MKPSPAQSEKLEQIIERHKNAVYRLAFARTRNRADADDVFQEVFLRYYKKQPVFENETHERAWFLRVTLNCCVSFFRRSIWHRAQPLTDCPALTSEEGQLVEMLDCLAPLPRTILHLYYVEDLSTKEIARILGRKEGTVRMQLTRARRQLKELIEEGEYT